MPVYQLSAVRDRYTYAANPPVLDRVCFTIDHVHAGSTYVSSTYEVVKFLVDHQIPVTVFIQATNPSHDYEFDRHNAQMLYGLAPHLVTLGLHPLHSGHSQAQQTAVHNTINKIIKSVTGQNPTVLSYHGAGAGPEPGIRFPGIKYGRGIGSAWSAGTDLRLDTPVMPLNTVARSFAYTRERNAAGLSSTLFLHSQELTKDSIKKEIFDTYVTEVKAQRLQAVSYIEAMQQDFNDTASTPPSGGSTPETPAVTPPVTPPSSGSRQSLRLSASDKKTRAPLKADFKIKQSTGETVDAASNTASQQFSLPIGRYVVSATARGVTETKTLELTMAKGLHHIFLLPEDASELTPTQPATPTTPISNTGATGSIRLSASDKTTRRPVKANFLIQDSSGKTISVANNVETQAFRIPANAYFITATVGTQKVSANVNLTSSKGIHHIFLIPAAGTTAVTTPVTPTTPTTPSSSTRLGSLRLSASEKQTRRPMNADFIIEDLTGKLIATAAQTKTELFRIPEGTYNIKAHANGKVSSQQITLTHTQGRHYIFLLA